MKSKTSNYLGRGIHKKRFYDSLTKGNLKQMLIAIKNDNDLDIQIRNNYINIYYNGSNIGKIKGENSIEFDKYYFYIEKKEKLQKDIAKNKDIKDKLEKKKLSHIKKFKNRNYKDYFADSKKIIDKWLEKNSKPERKEQHKISRNNQSSKTDYTIIDLEYQVSRKSDFACTYIPKGKEKPKNPRFDIIAINKKGEVCVIELKKGLGALEGSSGLREHWNCFKESIKQNPEPFIDEMKYLLEQKQALGLIDKQLIIKNSEPKFIFAYSYDDKTAIKNQDDIFNAKVKKINSIIEVIKLTKEKSELIDND